jgi:hypothetical protein
MKKLTADDVFRAAAQIKAVQENTPTAASAADSPSVPASQADDWMESTEQAFENAKQSEHPSAELSKLFFMASLFGDPTSDQITVYGPAPHNVAWMVKDGGHYGFGPYTFDVDHNQIIHLAYSGSPLTSSAADIPAVWAQQGLGN